MNKCFINYFLFRARIESFSSNSINYVWSNINYINNILCKVQKNKNQLLEQSMTFNEKKKKTYKDRLIECALIFGIIPHARLPKIQE